MWTKNKPEIEGWYFWRKRLNQNDSFRWLAYYIDQNGQLWDQGTASYYPEDGWWLLIDPQ